MPGGTAYRSLFFSGSFADPKKPYNFALPFLGISRNAFQKTGIVLRTD
ncbi:MAG: hypothetical protein OJF59_000480 [Cytophagales bacterium]|nr:MAG: hypothetical protein OJF59_000480 [Cytophagales bacterium]